MAAYRKLDRNLRERIENFCRQHIESLIAALRPRQIVFIGFKAMKTFTSAYPEIENAKKRVLVASGKVAGYPALGVLHLTGCRISTNDREQIGDRLRRLIS